MERERSFAIGHCFSASACSSGSASLVVSNNEVEVDPLLGRTQTWKLSHRRFIKREKRYSICVYSNYTIQSSLCQGRIFSLFSVFFKVNRTQISQRGMSSFSIVKHFDVVKGCYFYLFSTRKDCLTNTFFFKVFPKNSPSWSSVVSFHLSIAVYKSFCNSFDLCFDDDERLFI